MNKVGKKATEVVLLPIIAIGAITYQFARAVFWMLLALVVIALGLGLIHYLFTMGGSY